MRPLRDRIVVRPDDIAEHVTSTGVVVHARDCIHSSREQLGRTGTVVEVGTCRARYEDRNGKHAQRYRQQPPELAQGDRILFGEFSYPEIEGQGLERLLVLSEADVIGVIEPDEIIGLKDSEKELFIRDLSIYTLEGGGDLANGVIGFDSSGNEIV